MFVKVGFCLEKQICLVDDKSHAGSTPRPPILVPLVGLRQQRQFLGETQKVPSYAIGLGHVRSFVRNTVRGSNISRTV